MFSIGAFSRLAQLSVRVLRHYDEIGLLKPAHTNPTTGYRYYTSKQLADVNRIVALKDLGLRLEQVQLLMKENLSPDMLVGLLHVEKARAEQERNEAERRFREVERRLVELSDLGRLSEIDVVEKEVPATPYLAYRTTVDEVSDAYALMTTIVERCEPLGPWSPFIAVAYDDFFDTRHLDIELGYPVSSPDTLDLGSGRRLSLRELPSVERMLSVVYVGTQEDGHRRSHNAIALWLERHRCEMCGPGRELIHGPERGAEQTIEIQYPICDVG